MSAPLCFDSVVGRLNAGDPAAADLVFNRFANRLVQLAAGRLHGLLRHDTAPEDVVQSVFRSFFMRQRDGQFDLASWDRLWDVLVIITLRKCCNRVEYHHAACRDVRREVPLEHDGTTREPTPSEALELAETVEQLLGRFQDRERAVVELSLQGCPVADISARLGCSERKVYRVRERVRLELTRMQADTMVEPVAR